jgi:hypothetical protein
MAEASWVYGFSVRSIHIGSWTRCMVQYTPDEEQFAVRLVKPAQLSTESPTTGGKTSHISFWIYSDLCSLDAAAT